VIDPDGSANQNTATSCRSEAVHVCPVPVVLKLQGPPQTVKAVLAGRFGLRTSCTSSSGGQVEVAYPRKAAGTRLKIDNESRRSGLASCCSAVFQQELEAAKTSRPVWAPTPPLPPCATPTPTCEWGARIPRTTFSKGGASLVVWSGCRVCRCRERLIAGSPSRSACRRP